MAKDTATVRVVVVGAGPAGMAAAIAAAERGARVTLCEQLARPGVKLLATGGGRCNVTTTAEPGEVMARFGRAGRFMAPALGAMGPAALREWLASLGVETCPDSAGRVYPTTNKAATVQAALWDRCRALGVDVRLGREVTGLRLQECAVTAVDTSAGPEVADCVILATGGRSYPHLGAAGSGYELARRVGHRIAEPTPALVGLVTREGWPGGLAGVSLPATNVRIDLPRQPKAGVTGELLFTHRGVSGPAVLDLSAEVAVLLGKHEAVPLRLSFLPGVAMDDWPRRMDAWRREHGRRRVAGLLAESLPAALAGALCERAGLAGATLASQLSAAAATALAERLANCPLHAVGTEGWGRAMVTRGGVRLKEVRPETLESRIVAGLHFAGELLDLDGPCGGYNLTWAFAAGWLAGTAALTQRNRGPE